jgi:N-methylhydantoinase B/oxoprolinase/acetone carboxylase alpha subunit
MSKTREKLTATDEEIATGSFSEFYDSYDFSLQTNGGGSGRYGGGSNTRTKKKCKCSSQTTAPYSQKHVRLREMKKNNGKLKK